MTTRMITRYASNQTHRFLTLSAGAGRVRLDMDVGASTFGTRPPKVWTAQELFVRNIGTREDQDTAFPPHKIIGNLYYVGTRTLGSFLIADAAGTHSDQQRLRAKRPDGPRIDRGARIQVHRRQDPARQPRARRSHGRRRAGQAAHRRHGDGDGVTQERAGARRR